MFEFTTLTVLNSVVPATLAQFLAGTAASGANFITTGGNATPLYRIGNCRFNTDDIIDAHVKIHSDELLTEVTFDMDDIDGEAANYRIVLYLSLNMGSQDSFYSNDFVYKGKPLFIEFPVGASDTAAAIAKKVASIAKKYMLFMMGNAPLLKVSVNSSEVTFKGVNGYQNITKAVLQKYDPEAIEIDCCAKTGAYVDVKVGVPLMWEQNKSTGVVTVGEKVFDGETEGGRALESNEVGITPGVPAFGDYNWLLNNLRLPTSANTDFWAVNKNEMPVPGGKYNQYIIRICKKRDGIAGEVVGQRALSVTTHVFYVLDSGSNLTPFTTMMTALSSKKFTRADDVFEDPFVTDLDKLPNTADVAGN